MSALSERYERTADVGGHAPECRRRVVPTILSDSRGLDPERCARCVYLTDLLDMARAGRRIGGYPR